MDYLRHMEPDNGVIGSYKLEEDRDSVHLWINPTLFTVAYSKTVFLSVNPVSF